MTFPIEAELSPSISFSDLVILLFSTKPTLLLSIWQAQGSSSITEQNSSDSGHLLFSRSRNFGGQLFDKSYSGKELGIFIQSLQLAQTVQSGHDSYLQSFKIFDS